MPDVLILTPPFSPSDSGPPAGPSVLVGHLRAHGQTATAIDLNIRFLRQSVGGCTSRAAVVGDHAKDQARVQASRRRYKQMVGLPEPPAGQTPDGVDGVMALVHGFDAIHAAVDDSSAGERWDAFHGNALAGLSLPLVVGISIMGPAQVVPALHLARWAHGAWPDALIVAGGSHVTLLREAIAIDHRYGKWLHGFLPGHSEASLLRLVQARRDGVPLNLPRAGDTHQHSLPELPARCWHPPQFDPDELALYDQARLALPLQLSRGCDYGRCRMCTYPAVEEHQAGDVELLTTRFLTTPQIATATRLSVKDSLFTLPAMRAFGRTLRQNGSRAVWSGTTKLTRALARPELPAELHALGCRTLEFGVESIHRHTQRLIDKRVDSAVVEQVVRACVGAGIAVVINLIYGFPGETLAHARAQAQWFRALRRTAGPLVHGSHNLLEMNRAAPFTVTPHRWGIELGRAGPWAFSHVWNAPTWRRTFASELAALRAEVDQ